MTEDHKVLRSIRRGGNFFLLILSSGSREEYLGKSERKRGGSVTREESR